MCLGFEAWPLEAQTKRVFPKAYVSVLHDNVLSLAVSLMLSGITIVWYRRHVTGDYKGVGQTWLRVVIHATAEIAGNGDKCRLINTGRFLMW